MKHVIKALGFENSYHESKIVMFGAPMDITLSYKSGTRYGPKSIREVSEALETYSVYQDKDLKDIFLCDDGDLELTYADIEDSLKKIESKSKLLMDDDKLPIMLGGEHLVTYPAVKSVYLKHKDLKIIHLDAHADLRESFKNEKNSHACAIKRVWDIVGNNCIYQMGIRSGIKEEFEFAKKHTNMNILNLNNINEVCKEIGNKPVYLTIDLDVLDPSIMPGVGTPEPGGISYNNLQNAILELTKLNIVFIDIVELSPLLDKSGISSIIAFKLIREAVLGLSNNLV